MLNLHMAPPVCIRRVPFEHIGGIKDAPLFPHALHALSYRNEDPSVMVTLNCVVELGPTGPIGGTSTRVRSVDTQI